MEIPYFTTYKAMLVLFMGFFGGLLTAITGTGLDVCIFSLATTLFRVSEKVMTPTSIINQAFLNIFAILFKVIWLNGVSDDALEYWMVCIPIVVLGAPLGAFLSSYVHRTVFCVIVYIIDVVQYICALILVHLAAFLIVLSIILVVASVTFFSSLAYLGEYLLKRELKTLETEQKIDPTGVRELQLLIEDDKQIAIEEYDHRNGPLEPHKTIPTSVMAKENHDHTSLPGQQESLKLKLLQADYTNTQ